MMEKTTILAYNTLGVGLNAVYVWLELGNWFNFQTMSELAGMLVPIFALAWWCIKIFQSLKHKKK